MDVLKSVLAGRQDKSPQVIELLQCLDDPTFNLQVCICSVGGVGSTELSNFLTRSGIRCNLLTDQDAIRHVNRWVVCTHLTGLSAAAFCTDAPIGSSCAENAALTRDCSSGSA
eukprot:GHRR01034091.1.p2 GENE.GHRR01034091.1~~GHRR01034091.1.p2  ORF type:complete len:113 (+),score=23.38 GHRR01034091.1:508-846(+)